MADKEEIKQQETPEKEEKEEKKDKKGKKDKKDDKKTETDEKKSLIARLLPKVIIVLVVLIFAGAGLILGRFLKAGSLAPKTAGASEQGQSSQLENLNAKDSEDGSEKSWYYHLMISEMF